ncbi:hypothetical protein MW887_000319 [Aspergillus wentii]|nr:hypothetical protein MW887_000319 [Aspergillus wentii]
MAHSYPPSQATLTGYLQDSGLHLQEPAQLSSHSLFGQSHYPESGAFWHNSPGATHPQQSTGLPIPTGSYPSSQEQQQQQQQQQPLLQPVPDQKKHKRTRSGCFTCRSRRIKCDETRPICDRCRKGSRDCVYPSPSSSKSGFRSGPKSKGSRPQSQGSDSSDRAEHEESRALQPIADEDEDEEGSVGSGYRLSPSAATTRSRPGLPKRHSTQSLRRRRTKQDTTVSRKEYSPGSSPSTESMSARSVSVGLFSQEPFAFPGTAQLPEDVRFYLAFHQEFLTYRHYFLKPNSDRFVHQSIIEFALQYEPLLYAVVGFSAYHHSLQTANGKMYTFLKYYNKALVLLRKSLGSGMGHSEATLITVLVLTTFEEFIGDWVNLIDHHQAAHALMRELLTPESTNMNELHSHIFLWYARFDVVAGILAGNETVLGREWYTAKEEYDAHQAALYPNDPDKQLVLSASINRRFGLDMASLYAKLSRGLIPIEEFVAENEKLSQTLERIKAILVRFNDSECTIKAYPHKTPLSDDDIVDPYIPGGLHYGPLWEVNYAWIDYLSTKAMFQYQSFLTLQQPPLSDLESLALEQCRLIETMVRWPEKENGYIFAFKNSIGIASMFLPKGHKYAMWSRRKLAFMEQAGYVLPPKFRTVLATLWQMPELNHWWLPNDEGCPEIIREIRAMTDERINNPRDDFRQSVRDMKTLFWKINLDDTESDKSPVSAGLPIRHGHP